MRDFDVQTIEIQASFDAVFQYVADAGTLPEWTHAFRSVSGGRATLATPRGSVEIELEVKAARASGTVDWIMTFPDGTLGRAFSRVVPIGPERTLYSFVLLAPPVPLEQLEGALADQAKVLGGELATLARKLAGTSTVPREGVE